eukprot:XP_001709857.1 Hypothetical protein GL50803_29267 [Giardia lamblia ATCC 50803]
MAPEDTESPLSGPRCPVAANEYPATAACQPISNHQLDSL